MSFIIQLSEQGGNQADNLFVAGDLLQFAHTYSGLVTAAQAGAWEVEILDGSSTVSHASFNLAEGDDWSSVTIADYAITAAAGRVYIRFKKDSAQVSETSWLSEAGASYEFDGDLPSDYASMEALQGRMKIDSTQIKHRLHTADYQNGGYKPSMPATTTNVNDADYKAFPAHGTVTALREAAEDGLTGASSTIPFVIEMDMVEAQIAMLLDSDMQVNFDGASPVWKAESNSNSPLLTALGDMDVVRDMSVGRDATISGDITADGNVSIGGDLDLDGTLTVDADATFQSNVDIEGYLQVEGQSTLKDSVTMEEDLYVQGNLDAESDVTVGDALSVGGTSQFDANVEMKADAQVSGKLSVHGDADFDVTTFDVDASGQISLLTASAAADAIEIKATNSDIDMNAADGIDLVGNVKVYKDLEVSQSLTVKGDATIEDNATLNGDLQVDGTSTLKGDVTAEANLDVDGNVGIGGSATVEHEMLVKGDATFEKDLVVDGAGTISGDLTVAGSVDINASTFSLDASDDIELDSGGDITIDAAAGTLKLQGANGIEFSGSASFENDVTIKDQLVITDTGSGADSEEPDFIIKHGTDELVHFDGSDGQMEVEIKGDLTVGGSLIVTDAIEVDGSTVNVVATVSTMADNIIEINKDNTGSHKSVGVLLDGASSEKDFFFGINKDQDRFVLSKEKTANLWSDNALAENDKSDISHTDVEAAELHAGDARFEGLVDIASDLKVGGASPTFHVDVAGQQAVVDGDAIIEAQAEVQGDLDVDGNADIQNSLQVQGKLEVDSDGSGGYSLVVASADANGNAAGLSGVESASQFEGVSIDRKLLGTGFAHMILDGDLQMQNAKFTGHAAIDGELQARGDVGLGDGNSKVRVFGEFEAAKSAKFEESLRVHWDGAAGYDLKMDAALQSNAGLAISSRELDAADGAFMQLADDKDALFKGDVGVKGMVAVGGDIWFADHLRSKAEFLLQDKWTDGTDGAGSAFQYTDKDLGLHTVMGYTLAKDAPQIQAVLSNAPAAEAIVDIDGDKHISIMGILSGLISGGSTLRFEYELAGFIAKDTAFDLDSGDGSGAPVIHPNDSDAATLAEYKSSIRLFHNGQRLSNDDYELVYSAVAGEEGTKLKLNFAIEKDDVLIMDINDTNPAA